MLLLQYIVLLMLYIVIRVLLPSISVLIPNQLSRFATTYMTISNGSLYGEKSHATPCKCNSYTLLFNYLYEDKMTKNKYIEAYEKIISITKPFADLSMWKNIRRDDIWYQIQQIQKIAENQKMILERNEKYWLWIPYQSTLYNCDYCDINRNIYIKYCKDWWEYISWSDDWRHPNNEWLVCFHYPTGAYFFWSEYPYKTFNKFFNELKTFNPDYSDTNNKSLYFNLENAWKVILKYKDILQKYRDMAWEEIKNKKRKELEDQLAKLQ